jgi:hypothetical protein
MLQIIAQEMKKVKAGKRGKPAYTNLPRIIE